MNEKKVYIPSREILEVMFPETVEKMGKKRG